LVDVIIMAREFLRDGEAWSLDGSAVITANTLARDMSLCCGSYSEARCYTVRCLRSIETRDARDACIWNRARRDSKMSVGVPQTFAMRGNRTGLTSLLFAATLQFVTAASLSSLDAFVSAYIMRPCNTLLRAPAVVDCLFAVALYPVRN